MEQISKLWVVKFGELDKLLKRAFIAHLYGGFSFAPQIYVRFLELFYLI